jgi:hypothetical protein
MKVLRTAALTGIVIAAVIVLALEPASGASTDKNVASCSGGFAGHADADWRSESNVAGPVGVGKWPLRQMSTMAIGDLVAKAPLLVEGQSAVMVKVPEALRERVFLYYGRGPSEKTISFADSQGFGSIEFRPCEDRPRTIWPGGIRVRGKGSVHLVVEAEGHSTALRLGQPQLHPPNS